MDRGISKGWIVTPTFSESYGSRKGLLAAWFSNCRPTRTDDNKAALSARFGLTKIYSSDPPLTAVGTAYPTEPFLPVFTHQSSWPAFDQVADFTSMGGSTSRRSAWASALNHRC
jgi:hypothetical protein